MEEEIYNFNHKYRGVAVVIVNKTFVPGLKERRGSDKDLVHMEALFTKLGFRVKLYKNLKSSEIMEKLKKVASEKKYRDYNKESDCFVCVISTHGQEVLHTSSGCHSAGETSVQHQLFGSDGKSIFTADVVRQFNRIECPELAGKPKLFFIQACRSSKGLVKTDSGHIYKVLPDLAKETNTGQNAPRLDIDIDDPFPVQETGESVTEKFQDLSAGGDMYEEEDVSEDEWKLSQLEKDWMQEESEDSEEEEELEEDTKGKKDTGITQQLPLPQLCNIACYKDELIMRPIVSGLPAVRNINIGSYMLTFLYDELINMLPSEPLMNALTRVSGSLAFNFPTPEQNTSRKIVPCINHRLSKEIYFTKKQPLQKKF